MLSSRLLGQVFLKRRHSGSHLPFQIVEGDFPYTAPSTLPSALSFSGVLREDVEVESTTSYSATAPPVVAPPEVVSSPRDSFFADDECAICQDSLSDEPVAMIQLCRHTYHERCIRDWLGRQPRCPSCNGEVVVTPPGSSPSGTMTIQLCPGSICPGFAPDTTCIEIIYYIPAGTQHAFHETPYTPYQGATRNAYLPNNEEGRRLLTRLKIAFAQGLTFTIGISLTTYQRGVVVWTRAFDHKTSLSGGIHGFPDHRYIPTCNAQLDALGIPPGASSDQTVQHNQVLSYTAPQVLPPPRLLPNVLQPIARVPRVVSVENVENLWQASRDSTAAAERNISATGVGASNIGGAGASTSGPPHLLPLTGPKRSVSNSSHSNRVPDMECPICLELLSQRPVAQSKICQHVFHHDCILKSLELQPRCPVCQTYVREPQGRSPSGTMSIKCLKDKICPGFNDSTTIEFVYNIPSGIQMPYHDHPGTPHSGTRRVAYIPNNPAGQRLLTRLKNAWEHGLTFTVGTSLTNGCNNVVTWTSIPHKTRLDGTSSSSPLFQDPHGFPDSNYLTNCNNALDALGVPDADTCLEQPRAVASVEIDL